MQAFCFFYYLNIITMNNETETTFKYSIFLDSSMVEHTAVNRGVVGSSPTRGADNPVKIIISMDFCLDVLWPDCYNKYTASQSNMAT